MQISRVKRIINACNRATKKGLEIPFYENFDDLEAGVAAHVGEVYVSDREIICPLGALVLGRKRISDQMDYICWDAARILVVGHQWVRGFLKASDKISLPKKPNHYFSREFISGFKAGLKVRSVIYRQQSTPEKGARQCLVY